MPLRGLRDDGAAVAGAIAVFVLLDFSVVAEYWPVFLQGLGITVSLTITVILIAGVLAIPVALARLSKSRWLRWPADLFVEVIRATPLMLQLTYIYYVFPGIGIRLSR